MAIFRIFIVIAFLVVSQHGGAYAQESSSAATDVAADDGKGTCNATESSETTRKFCAPLSASHVRRHLGIEPTFFLGGWSQNTDIERRVWNWPKNWFALSLKHYGWQDVGKEKEACSEATFKILYADKTNREGKIYEQHCHSEDNHPALAFGFDNLHKEFGAKDRFVHNIRDYERSKQLDTSVVPLSFHFDQALECKAFFELPDVEQGNWISKATNKFGGQGVDAIDDFEKFREKFGNCSSPPGAPQVQEFLEPTLIEGKVWFIRFYVFIVNQQPLRAVRREYAIWLCSEPYERRNDPDPVVRRRATNCNPYVTEAHPDYKKEELHKWKKPLSVLNQVLGDNQANLFLEKADVALATAVRAMGSIMSTETASPDHVVGHYAIDGMMDSNGDYKMLEFNPSPGRDNEAQLEAEARIALTTLLQYSLENETYSIDACLDIYPQFAWLDLD